MKRLINILIIGVSLNAFGASPVSPNKKEISYEVKPVFGLNTQYAEFSPVLYKQEFVFASDRDYNLNIIGEDNWNKVKHINIFKADFKNNTNDSMVFNKIDVFDNVFVADDHVGPVSFDGEGKTAFFAKINLRKQKVFGRETIRPQLFMAKNVNGKWEDVQKMPFVRVNYSYSHPFVTSDGQKLYFASDAVGAKGGTDIFVSELVNGEWQEPKVVDVINSEAKEMFPSLVGNTLYFASDRSGGEGGLDLYMSVFENGNWSEPVNLGNTINSSADDFSIIFNPNGMSGYFTSNRDNGKGDDDIYYFNKIETVIVPTQTIEGQFEYRYLKGQNPGGLEVMLMDEDGNMVMKTTTDETGKFEFKELPYGKKYTIKTIDESGDVVLTLFGDESDTYLLSNKEGSFIYRKLNYENVGTLMLMDEGDVDMAERKGSLNGQFFYEKLEGHPDQMEVLLVDEDGNVVLRTTTDKYGNFNFKELPMDKNYIIKINEGDEIGLILFNKDDNIIAELEKDASGEFVYRKLNPLYSDHLDMLTDDESTLKFSERKMAITGEFDFSKLESKPDKLPFDILDKDGNLVLKGETDDKGYFNYNSLPMMDEMMIKISEGSPLMNEKLDLRVINRTRDIVIVLTQDSNGYYIYRKLNYENDVMATEDGNNSDLENKNEVSKLEFDNMLIYYAKNSYDLGESDFKGLNYLAVAMTENPDIKVEVNTYASAPGSSDFNLKLTQRRLKKIVSYLEGKGISKDRIVGKAYGETKLVNDCKSEADCDEEEHGKNRRAEIIIVK